MPFPDHSSALLETVTGLIERITFHSDTTGFCVLRVQVKGKRDLLTVVGTALNLHVGESIEAHGYWSRHKEHGLQFKAAHLQVMAPTSLVGIEKYLSSGMVKGIGPHFAKQLVTAFGEAVFEVIEQAPERLTELPGIGEKRKQQLLASWQAQKVIRRIMVFLQGHGISSARAVRIYKTYGDEAVAKIQENPYRLARDVYGIGFKTADTLARKLDIPEDSPLRAMAGVEHVMQDFSSEGHCAVPVAMLQEKTQALLEIPESIVETAIGNAIFEERLMPSERDGQPLVFLAALYQAEVSVAKHLKRLMSAPLPWDKRSAALCAAQIQPEMALSDSQRAALREALNAKVFILTGGPGVGKTTVVKSLLTILKSLKGPPLRMALCAPTGRAAKRLSETTGGSAKTIHRLLEFDPKAFRFKHDQQNPLSVDLLIVDEASMLDIVLTNHLLKALLSQAALILIGDVDQLPSVGPGRVLADLIESGRLPRAQLTEIFRQAASSRIIVNAHRVNHGQMPLLTPEEEALSDFYFIEAEVPESIHDKILQLVSERIPKRFKVHPVRDIQVLTPMHRGGVGAQALNAALQTTLNAQATPRISRFGSIFAPGDKVIQHVNNYDKDVFNGDIGYIVSIDLEQTCLQVDFEGRAVSYDFSELDELALAYAMSIHKSQGSEYPAVVIPVAMSHYRMLARNLLYTGITRGKQLVVLVGQKKALWRAVQTMQSHQRLTLLRARLEMGWGSPV